MSLSHVSPFCEVLCDGALCGSPMSLTTLGSPGEPHGQGPERSQEAGAPGQTLGVLALLTPFMGLRSRRSVGQSLADDPTPHTGLAQHDIHLARAKGGLS